MEIVIQGYWGAKVKSIEGHPGMTPEKYLEKNPEIHVCDVIIDGKRVGTVSWNGKELGIRIIDRRSENEGVHSQKTNVQ